MTEIFRHELHVEFYWEFLAPALDLIQLKAGREAWLKSGTSL